MMILGKVRDRQNKFVFEFSDMGGMLPNQHGIHQICTSFLHHFYDMDLQLAAPILTNMKFATFMDFQVETTLFIVIFFMFAIDVIVIYSIMVLDVEERTYEFAMLRCLGF